MSVQASEPLITTVTTTNDNGIKIPGYDGPTAGNTRTTSTQKGSATQAHIETVTRTTQVHKTCRGPISFKEVNIDGKYIIIENNGKRGDIDISDWQIVRKVDNENDNIFTFPLNTILRSGASIKIWSANQGQSNPPDEFVHTTAWGDGDLVNTRLLNREKSERALHNQRTS